MPLWGGNSCLYVSAALQRDESTTINLLEERLPWVFYRVCAYQCSIDFPPSSTRIHFDCLCDQKKGMQLIDLPEIFFFLGVGPFSRFHPVTRLLEKSDREASGGRLDGPCVCCDDEKSAPVKWWRVQRLCENPSLWTNCRPPYFKCGGACKRLATQGWSSSPSWWQKKWILRSGVCEKCAAGHDLKKWNLGSCRFLHSSRTGEVDEEANSYAFFGKREGICSATKPSATRRAGICSATKPSPCSNVNRCAGFALQNTSLQAKEANEEIMEVERLDFRPACTLSSMCFLTTS